MNIPHPHKRGIERLNLSPESVNSLQKAVDNMWFGGGYKKLRDDYYYINIRDPYKNLLGYASLKQVNKEGARPRLILSSILSKNMKPKGSNISHFVDTEIKDNQARLHLPPKFKKLPPIPNNVDKH